MSFFFSAVFILYFLCETYILKICRCQKKFLVEKIQNKEKNARISQGTFNNTKRMVFMEKQC